ncbi:MULTISPECIES: ABC transporter substrate-binding protein [Paenibacillus]|uniref:ABC transporter substrate-binding protein n=1 Tax=Paenibacillus TaxID=44249 RepID=UPI0022B90568|nr:ABC transporter substrate-binding protein [Paenibacillus caseinilyticus]MCZ8523167.1 ABC transporter substrate-binding protein [Paenibacillus caseinilyticus]
MNRKLYRSRTNAAIAVLLTACLVLAGCGKGQADTASAGAAPAGGQPEVLELRYQGSPGTVSLPELAEDLGYLAPLKLKWIGNTTSGPQSIQAATTGDTDFGGAFNGAIVKLLAAKAPITALFGYYGEDAKTYNGYYVLEDSPIKGPKDLVGKQIAMNTLGAHHEFMVKEYLHRAGLTNEEIKQVTLLAIPPANGEQVLRQKQVEVSTLGGIYQDKALERGGLRPVFTDLELFGEFTAGSIVMTNKFIKNNPNTTKQFVEGVAKAIEWSRTTPREEVIARMEKIAKDRGRSEDTSNIKYWKSWGIAGKGGLIAEKEFQVWIDWLVKDGQIKEGQVKASDMYTNRFNPFQEEGKTAK